MSQGRFNPESYRPTPSSFRRGEGKETFDVEERRPRGISPVRVQNLSTTRRGEPFREEREQAFRAEREASRGRREESFRGEREEFSREVPMRRGEVSRGRREEPFRGEREVSRGRREVSRGRGEEPFRGERETSRGRVEISRREQTSRGEREELPVEVSRRGRGEVSRGRGEEPFRGEREEFSRETRGERKELSIEVSRRGEREVSREREVLPTRRRELLPARETFPEAYEEGTLPRPSTPRLREEEPFHPRKPRRDVSPPPVREREELNPIIRTKAKQRILVKKEMGLAGLEGNVLKIIASFLPPRERTGLSVASHNFDDYLKIYPIDLSSKKVSLDKFLEFFETKPDANVMGLWIFLSLDQNLEPLVPFLPRLRSLKISQSTNLYIRTYIDKILNINPLKECKKLSRLSLNIRVLSYDVLPSLPGLVYLQLRLDSDKSLIPLANCIGLHKLVIDTNLGIINNNIMESIDGLPELRSLEINSGNLRNNKGSLANFPQLEDISLNNCDIGPNFNLISKSKTLKKCSLSLVLEEVIDLWDTSNLLSCPNLEDISLTIYRNEAVIETNPLSSLSKLRKLALVQSRLSENATFVNFPSLRELELLGVNIKHELKFPLIIEKKNSEGRTFTTGLTTFKLEDSLVETLPKLENISELREITIQYSPHLVNADFITQCPKLTRLTINNSINPAGRNWNFLRGHSLLTDLVIRGHISNDLLFLEGCANLRHVTLDDYGHGLLSLSIEGLKFCPLLESIMITGSMGLKIVNISGLNYTPELKIANFSTLSGIEDFTPLTKCTKLQTLKFSDALFLKNFDFLENHSDLEVFHAENCGILADITGLVNCPKLRELHLGSQIITDISPVGLCLNLQELIIVNCPELLFLTGIEKLKNLTKLELSSVNFIQSLDPIAGCAALEEFTCRPSIFSPKGNEITISLLPLAKCRMLRFIDYKRSLNFIDLKRLLVLDPPNLVTVYDAYGIEHKRKNGKWNLNFFEADD